MELCTGDSIELCDKTTASDGQEMKKKSLLHSAQNEQQKSLFLVVCIMWKTTLWAARNFNNFVVKLSILTKCLLFRITVIML